MSRRAVLLAVQDTELESRLLLAGDSTSILLAASAPSTIHGANLTLTATVSDLTTPATTPTDGTVTFLDGTTTLGTGTLTNGTATFSTTALAAGKHNLTATYAGSGSFGASQSGITASSTISTVAGNGTAGNSDSGDGGPATDARLNGPTGVACDASGNLYIVDIESNVVRKVTSGGVISTVAGTGKAGNNPGDGQATATELNEPVGVAVDAMGDLFIADTVNNVVREVTTDGRIQTIAGTGTAGDGGDNGLATAATLSFPQGVAVDAAGDLFIADTGNNVVREVTTDGKIHTVPGLELNDPAGVAVDAMGNLFIADTGNNVVREVTSTGGIETVAGTGTADDSGNNGPATAADLDHPTGVAVDASGNLYITEQDDAVVRVVTPAGLISILAGSYNSFGNGGDGGAASAAHLGLPHGVAIDAAGDLDIADQGYNVVRQVKVGLPVTVAASGPATSLTLTGAVDETAGGDEHLTVTAYDAYGNVATGYTGTVHFTSSDDQAVLPGDATLTNGTGTFNVTLKTAGTEAITATDSTTPGLSASQSGIVVTPATAASFTIGGGVNETAGGVEAVTVTAYDAYGNVATGYTGTVHLTSNDRQAVLPADATLTNGTGTFDVTLKTAGTEAIIATDTTNAALSAGQLGIVVTPATAASFTIGGGVNEMAGGVEAVTVTAYDAYGNVATSYTGTVHLTSSDRQAVLPANATLNNGTGTFDVTLKTAGTEAITATDATTSSITGVDGGIVVTPAAVAKLAMTGAVDETAGGVEHLTVTAYDAYGNVATGDSGTIHLTSSDAQASLPADAPLASGIGTFDVTLRTARIESITGSDTMLPSLRASQTGLVVIPAATNKLVLTGASDEMAGGVEHLTIVAYDAYGNVATGDTGTIHLTSDDAQATLPAAAPLTGGVGAFDLTLKTVGSDSITATDTSGPTLAVSDSAIVTPAAATRLVLTGLSDETAGGVETGTITAYDAYGNVATGYAGTVHLTSSDSHATYPATVTPTAGVAHFTFKPVTAGARTLSVADSADATVAGSATISVAPAPATALVVTGAVGGIAGTVERVTITALDAYGNIATGYTGTLHLSSSDLQATLPGAFALTAGTATVPVTLVTAGTDSITATDTQAASLTGSATAIAVTPATTTRFVITGPATTIAGQGQTDTVTATDAYGNFTPNYSGTVHVSSSDLAAVLPADTALSAGVGSIAVTLESAGSQTITATDPTSGATGSLAGVTTTAMIQGTVYLDLNGNGTLDAGETGLAGRVVYLDLNHSGTFATSDPTATTDAQGHFSFPGVAAGSVPVLEATTQDATDRYVLDQTATAPDGSLTIGAVPFSPLNPILILPTSAAITGSDATTRYVQSLYQAVLGRVGAADEVAGWVALMAQGTTAQQVATSFVDSLEHRTDEVAAFYSSFLHRATDPAAEGWVAELMSGASEATVAEGILDSPEYQSAHPDSTSLVRDLYLDVLGRQASTGEVTAWQAALTAGGTPQQVVSSLVQSPEANDQIVESLYVADLHRPREAGTSTGWTAMLSASDSAAAVAADILSSTEFQRNA